MKTQILLLLAWTLSIAAQQQVYRGQPNNAGIPAKVDKNCKCWVEWYRRVPCSGGAFLSQSFCEAAGCCYFADKEHYSAHRCYQDTGRCPSPECIVDVTKRKACGSQNRHFVPQHLCATKGCCHSKFAKPNCYKGKAVAKPTPYSPPDPHPYFVQNRLKPHLFQKLDRLGPFHFVSTCYLQRKRCGGYGVKRHQCIRFGCCWEANENYGLIKAECFSAVRFWLDYPFGDASWNNWNNWTPCSGPPCVSGTRKRTRTCKGDYLPHKSCSGPTQQEEACNGPCAGASWSPFNPGSCNSPEPLCLSGQSIERRTCVMGGMPVADFNCAGLPTRPATCNSHLCSAYDNWTPFGDCSETCGNGLRSRIRTCTSPGTGVPPAECSRQEMNCDLGVCPVADWGDYTIGTTCASDYLTCLAGIRTDTRQCLLNGQVVDDSECTGLNYREVACNTHLCSMFGFWSDWTSCNAPCGDGTQQRIRTCASGTGTSPPECLTESRNCNLGSCVADWGDFMIGTTCASDESTCLAGIRTDTRQCLLDGQVVADSECTGLNYREVSCNTSLCLMYDNWSTISPCSLTCGSGLRDRTRTCSSPGTESTTPECLKETIMCNTQTCPVADWGDYTIGTTCASDEPTCLAGIRTDTRQCLLDGQVVDDSECTGANSRAAACNTHLCSMFGFWSDWSSCNAPCGDGTQQRTRTCASGTGTSPPECTTESMNCNLGSCNVAVDVIFLLDGSLTMSDAEFAGQRAWLQGFVALLDINSGRDRVGVIRYDNDAITQFVPTSTNLASLQLLIGMIQQRPEQESYIGAAINRAVTLDFPSDRPGSKKVLVVLTDGTASDPGVIPTAIAAANNAGVQRYAVELLGFAHTALLTQIVGGDPARVLREDDINNLSVLNTALLNLIYS